MMRGEVPSLGSRQISRALFVKPRDFLTAEIAHEPSIQKTAKQRVQPVLFIRPRSVRLRYENVSPAKRAQLVRTISYPKRDFTNHGIDAFEQ